MVRLKVSKFIVFSTELNYELDRGLNESIYKAQGIYTLPATFVQDLVYSNVPETITQFQ